MSGPRLYTVEEATHQAYDIFLELAPNNLSDKDVEDFNEFREDLGFIEEDEPDDDVLFAKILISRDKDAPFCHILWKESE